METKNKPKLTYEEYIQRGNKRLAIFNSIWIIIGTPFVFLFDQNNLAFFVLFLFMPYVLIGLWISPYAVHKIWKN